jgi:DNA-binding LytR/AlgR family response regulator
MWRLLLLAILLTALPTALRAQNRVPSPIQTWESCRADPGAATPALHDCRPVEGLIDPQGRELWLRATVRRPTGDAPVALYVVGTAASEVWLNGQGLGVNGRPGASAATETAGRYQIAFPIADRMWAPAGDNTLIIHMSSFHGAVHLDSPIAGLLIAPYPWSPPTGLVAMVFLMAGTLFAAAFGFGVIHGLRRTGSSLMLATLAAVAGLQAVLESLRTVVSYPYPVHGWRLVGIWGLSAVFAVLLVLYAAARFWPRTVLPRARTPLIAAAGVAVAATLLAPGFDLKTVLALLIGVGVSALAAAVGVRRRLPGARPILAWLLVFLSFGLAFPAWLADLTYFLFAAGLILPLLMAEVVRLGRDDQKREAALTRAAARPHCLTVASSRGVERVPLTEIIAVVGADDYVELRLTGGRRLLHAGRLDRLEADLPAGFLRIHRSVIANLAHVRALARDGDRARLLMTETPPLPVSRNRLPTVRDRIEEPGLPAG